MEQENQRFLFNCHRFEVTNGQIIMNGTDVTLKNAQEILNGIIQSLNY